MVGRDAAAVAIRQQWNAARTQPWILAGARKYAVPRTQQIGPGREQDGAGRHGHLFVPQCLEKRQRESSAGRFTSDDDAVMRVSLGQQESVSGACVQEGCGECVFRRQAVFGEQQAAAGRLGNVRGEAPMGLAGANEIAAAVQIEKGCLRPSVPPVDPFRGNAEGVDGRSQHRLCHGEKIVSAAVHGFALVRNRTVQGKTAVAEAKVEFEELTADAWHFAGRAKLLRFRSGVVLESTTKSHLAKAGALG